MKASREDYGGGARARREPECVRINIHILKSLDRQMPVWISAFRTTRRETNDNRLLVRDGVTCRRSVTSVLILTRSTGA